MGWGRNHSMGKASPGAPPVTYISCTQIAGKEASTEYLKGTYY